MFDLKVHYRLYLSLLAGLVFPLTVLVIFQPVPVESLPFAFMALLVFVRIMSVSDKLYLEQARRQAREILKQQKQKEPRLGEVEVMAQRMVHSRNIVYFVIGGLQLAHMVFV